MRNVNSDPFLLTKGFDRKYSVEKFCSYFDIYDKHFHKFKGRTPNILEIGVNMGGSLEMWGDYFDWDCKIYGVDINPECSRVELPYTEIHIGDASEKDFWDEFKSKTPKMDIVIDDGGHRVWEQKAAYENLFEHMKCDSVYLCEDLEFSYLYYLPSWSREKKRNTFVEYTKGLIDLLNAWFWRRQEVPDFQMRYKSSHREDMWGCLPPDSKALDFCKKVNSITYYENVVVLEFNSEIKIEYGEILNKPLQGRKSRRDPPNIIYGRGKNDIWK